jgi:outer membrane protein assembly factor BamB
VELPETAAWPTFRYDAANTGYAPDTSGPKDDVAVCWRYSACTEADAGVVVGEGAVCAGGVVVDGQTGQAMGGEWHGHMSTPTIAEGMLYTSAFDLEARDLATGEVQWTFQTEVDMGALPAPTVNEGTVYVPGSLDDPIVYAVDAASGDEHWRFEAAADVHVPVAVADETVYFVDDRGTLYSLDGATGDERWTTPHLRDISLCPPVIDGDRLFLATSDGLITASHTDDGSTAWQRRVNQSEAGLSRPVAVADGTVYTTDHGGTIATLDATDGQIEWTATTDAGPLGPPAVADGAIYAGNTGLRGSGFVFAFDRRTGDELWRVDTRSVQFGDYTRVGINGSPAVVDGAVYVASAPGEVYAIHARS